MGSRPKAKSTPKAGTRNRTRDLTARHAGQVKGGKVSYADFSFTKKLDKASPSL